MVTISRRATHSGSWYSSNPAKLNAQIDGFLERATSIDKVPGARVILGPHAGYSYAGKTLAETFKVWDNSNVKRIFILGPSHHVYFNNVAYVSGVDYYETPFGSLPVDKNLIKILTKKHKSIFKIMDLSTDEEEHSFEMHTPYIYKMCQSLAQGQPSIIPIMISHTDEQFNKDISEILEGYLKDPTNHFIISSDFCHWGMRFGYTRYSPTGKLEDLTTISRGTSKAQHGNISIYKSIEMLDKYAMKVASTGSSESWRDYIKITGNTICGQKPILLVLKTLELNVKSQETNDKDFKAKFKWIGYTQSNKVLNSSESSVSYASGYVIV